MECKICPFQFSLECSDCSSPFKERKKEIGIRIWVKEIETGIERKKKLLRKHKFKTIIEVDHSQEKWRERALKELRRKFHCNGYCKGNQIIISGKYQEEKIIQLLSFFLFMLYV